MRKFLNFVTVAVLAVLVVCTFVSKAVSEAGTPVVEEGEAVGMTLAGEEYDMVVPSSVVFSVGPDSFVWVVKQRKGLFGPEAYVSQTPVGILAEENGFAALGGRYITGHDRFVFSCGGTLTDGGTVRVSGGD